MLRSTLLVILFAFSSAAFADDFNYNSVSVGYVAAEFDDDFGGSSADGDLLAVNGSVGIGESFFAFGTVSTGEVDDILGTGSDNDLTLASVGVGYHMPLSESVDLVASLSYEYIEVSDAGISPDDNGLGFGLGMRFAASENIEIDAGINYVDYGDLFDERTSFNADFLYNFTENFTVGVGGEWGDDVTQYGISGRYYFGD